MSPLFIRFVVGVSACVMAFSPGVAMADGPQFNFPSQRNQDAAQAARSVPPPDVDFGAFRPSDLGGAAEPPAHLLDYGNNPAQMGNDVMGRHLEPITKPEYEAILGNRYEGGGQFDDMVAGMLDQAENFDEWITDPGGRFEECTTETVVRDYETRTTYHCSIDNGEGIDQPACERVVHYPVDRDYVYRCEENRPRTVSSWSTQCSGFDSNADCTLEEEECTQEVAALPDSYTCYDWHDEEVSQELCYQSRDLEVEEEYVYRCVRTLDEDGNVVSQNSSCGAANTGGCVPQGGSSCTETTEIYDSYYCYFGVGHNGVHTGYGQLGNICMGPNDELICGGGNCIQNGQPIEIITGCELSEYCLADLQGNIDNPNTPFHLCARWARDFRCSTGNYCSRERQDYRCDSPVSGATPIDIIEHVSLGNWQWEAGCSSRGNPDCGIVQTTCVQNTPHGCVRRERRYECVTRVPDSDCDPPPYCSSPTQRCIAFNANGQCDRVEHVYDCWGDPAGCVGRERTYVCDNPAGPPPDGYIDHIGEPEWREIGCPQLDPEWECEEQDTVCLDGPGTKLIDDVEVYSECWHERTDYICPGVGETVTDCNPDPSCVLQSEECMDDDCRSRTMVYECVEPGEYVQEVDQCRTVSCTNGVCIEVERDNAAAQAPWALAQLAALFEAHNFDEMTLMAGEALQCHKTGIWKNCCSGGGIAINWLNGSCNEEEQRLAQAREADLCVDVGWYCHRRGWFGCRQQRRTSCCFGSVLARIINEEGRAQLGLDFGEPADADCDGLTPEQFAQLDLSLMDFTPMMAEMMEGFAPEGEGSVSARIQQRVSDFYSSGVNTDIPPGDGDD